MVFHEGGPAAALAPRDGWFEVMAGGAATALAITAPLWLLRNWTPVRRLLRWQAGLVVDWSPADAAAVSVLSGLAEEALLRPALQPLIGLFPTAVVFAVLHTVPDRRLWFWPAAALLIGLVLGLAYEVWGYPAAALGHGLVNFAALHQLRSMPPEV